MPFALLDGTAGSIDIKIGPTGGTASQSFKNVANYWSADVDRDSFEAITFASGGWRVPIPGMMQLIGSLRGFASQGQVWSDPFALMASDPGVPIQAGQPFVLTAFTGCTLTGLCQVLRAHTGMQAALQSEFGVDFRSSGAVTSAWVTA